MDTKLGILQLKVNRGKPPKLQLMIIFQLTKNGKQSKTHLARILNKKESNISRAISILEARGIVTPYQSIKIKKKPGRPSNEEIRDSDSSNINRGRPHQRYGLTENGIKLILNKKNNLNLKDFWRLVFHYFKPNNEIIKMNIRDAFDQYETEVLGCQRRLTFTQVIRQEIISINTIKSIIENKNEPQYIDLLCRLAYTDLQNFTNMNSKLSTRVFSDLEELNLVKRDSESKKYSLTLLGILLFLQLISDIENDKKEIKSLGMILIFNRATNILDRIEKIRNDHTFLNEIHWPEEFKQFIFPYPHKMIGGSTWETSILYNALLDPFFENHSKKVPRVFGKWKQLRMIWSSRELYSALAFILKQVSDYESMPRFSTLVGEEGFQEIFDDFENMSSYYEDVLEKEHTVGWKIYNELNPKYNTNFDRDNQFAKEMIDELRIRLGFRDKPVSEKIQKELANQLYEEILPEWISFKFYTYLFQVAKNEFKFAKWLNIFKKDRELVNWYSEWLDRLNEYRNRSTIKHQEFRSLF